MSPTRRHTHISREGEFYNKKHILYILKVENILAEIKLENFELLSLEEAEHKSLLKNNAVGFRKLLKDFRG